MIVLRTTFRPSMDMLAIRDALAWWCEEHPEDCLRVYNTITGDQNVVVTEQTFADEELPTLGRALFDPSAHWSPAFRKFINSLSELDMHWDKRELLRLM